MKTKQQKKKYKTKDDKKNLIVLGKRNKKKNNECHEAKLESPRVFVPCVSRRKGKIGEYCG